MILAACAVLAGFGLLIYSADRFVEGASAIASHFGVSSLLIGVTVVGFGTSAPEIFIALIASLDGSASLAVGNAIGSNIANIGMILGATALMIAVPIPRESVRDEMLVLLGATLLAMAVLLDGHLSLIDGMILLAGFIGFVLWAIWQAKRQPGDEEDLPEEMSTGRAWLTLFIAMLILIGSSRLLVWGATTIATGMGVSELVIGLTIVAIGSSLPELAASLAAAKRGKPEMALGNVIGSNIFNTLAVLCVPALVASTALQPEVLMRDLPVMAAFTAALLFIVLRKKHLLSRTEGFLLMAAFVAYMVWLGLERAA
ncbi:MAG: calcium/sodium antiporter [Granulosicoccaceae bacterium]